MKILLILIPVLPLFAAVLLSFLPKEKGKTAGFISVSAAALSLIMLIILSSQSLDIFFTWLKISSYKITLGLQLDGLSNFIAIIVAAVSTLVTIYSTGYIQKEKVRFFTYFSFFTGAMLLLVLSNSFLLLFAAWEGVGIASFLLIGFHYEEKKALKAARKAFLVTRFADLGLMLAWLLILNWQQTTDIKTFLTSVSAGNIPSFGLSLISVLFLIGAFGKSAQIPFTSWLPDAMEGPTPVSALIHSATMVAAGVYLILRLFPLYQIEQNSFIILLWIGGLTAFIAALVASSQNDLKRILAWSTISQLGEMMLALGLGAAFAASFHLSVHAVFKSSLFLIAGIISHAAEKRDITKIRGFLKRFLIPRSRLLPRVWL